MEHFRRSVAQASVCLTHSDMSLSPTCGALLEGVPGRCRNIGFVIAFTCVLLVRRCWTLYVSLAVRAVEEAWEFVPSQTSQTSQTPRAQTGHISAVHVNNVRSKQCSTGQEEIQFDHILQRLWRISPLKYADIFKRLEMVQSGSLSTEVSDIWNSLEEQTKAEECS